jgi:hypothetical protein
MKIFVPKKTSTRSDTAIHRSPNQSENSVTRPTPDLTFGCVLLSRNAVANNALQQEIKKKNAPKVTQERKGGIRCLTNSGIEEL